MKRKRALFFFLIATSICSLFAFFHPFPENVVSNFQQKSVDATLLNFGETGKILKDLNLILPLEKKMKKGADNVVEVIGRATKDWKKWTQIDGYSRYREKGVFCYLEVESMEAEIPFVALVLREGKWETESSFTIVNNRKSYSFFLDMSGEKIPLQFALLNATDPLAFRNMVFLQSGYHPLVYTDSVSFSRIFSGLEKDTYELNSSSIVFPPDEKSKHLLTELHFRESWMVGVSTFHKKLGSTHVEMVPRNHHPLIVEKEGEMGRFADMSRDGLPIISIDVDEADLYSDDFGILKNFGEHGRDWERLSFVQYFRDGKQILAGFTGLRLQGGDPGREKGLVNFRLSFRKEYGISGFDGALIFDRSMGVIKRLAIKQSEWKEWPLNSPLAYDISHKIGAWTPPTEPVILYLNGKSLGLYYVVPHLGERQIQEMLPEGEYGYYRFRGAYHIADRHFFDTEFWMKLHASKEKITEKDMEQFFDLDNLTNQIFSYLYNGTGDYCQGIVVKDTAEGARMFWLSWDMDHSFIDYPGDITGKKKVERERWEQPPHLVEFFSKETEEKQHYCPRVQLFRRLVNDDPGFRERVKEVFMEIMNHRISDESINRLLYELWSDLTKVDYLYRDKYVSVLSEFFRHRKHFLIQQMEQDTPTASVRSCSVDADIFPILVDGYSKTKRYEGYYFPGSVLSLEVDADSTFQHWLIDGDIYDEYKVVVPVSIDQECKIKAVFRAAS